MPLRYPPCAMGKRVSRVLLGAEMPRRACVDSRSGAVLLAFTRRGRRIQRGRRSSGQPTGRMRDVHHVEIGDRARGIRTSPAQAVARTLSGKRYQ
jgi:hypothetical protein